MTLQHNRAALQAWMSSPYYTTYRLYNINALNDKVLVENIKRDISPDQLVAAIHTELQSLTQETKMPTRFIAVLMTFSVSNTIPEALKEWTNTHLDDLHGGGHCICSHWIQHQIFIKNKHNGNILLVGNECIKKLPFSNKLKEEIKRQMKLKRILDKNKIYKHCERCHDKVIEQEVNTKYCERCEKIIVQEQLKSATVHVPEKIPQPKQLLTFSQLSQLTGEISKLPIIEERKKEYRICDECLKLTIDVEDKTSNMCMLCIFNKLKLCDECRTYNVPKELDSTRCDDCISYNLTNFTSTKKLESDRDFIVAIWTLNVIQRLLYTSKE